MYYDNSRSGARCNIEASIGNSMYGYIYLTTNLINGRKYIGQKKWNKYPNKCQSYLGSGKILKQAITKYGANNFSCTILEWCKTKWELDTREKAWILMYNATKDPMFYNISRGGDGCNIEGGIGHPRSGSHHTEESKKKMSESHKLHPSFLGKHHTKEAKKKLSLANTGKHYTEETKQLLRETSKGNTHRRLLTEDQVLSIYNNPNKLSQKDLAEKYGVSKACINAIQNGYNWNEVTKCNKPKRVKKLTEEDVKFIWDNKGIISQQKLAEKYGVSRSLINDIHRKRIYKNLLR